MSESLWRFKTSESNLTGLLKAIEAEIQREGAVAFHVDSLYAIKIARGDWCPARGGQGANNRELARTLRRAYRRLVETRPRGHVSLVHERAHVGTRGNEVADALAKRGTECGNEDGVCEREPTHAQNELGRSSWTRCGQRPPPRRPRVDGARSACPTPYTSSSRTEWSCR